MTVKAKYFKIYELVDEYTYEQRKSKAWELIDRLDIKLLDTFRRKFGKIVINDWYWGGNFNWSGLQTLHCTKYSEYSMNRFSKGWDLKFMDTRPMDVRKHIRENKDWWIKQGLTCVSINTKSYLHIDRRNCKPIKWIRS